MFFNARWKDQEKINTRMNLRVAAIDTALHDSFGKVKHDISHINQWITYLHNTHDQINAKLSQFENTMETFLTREELKQFIDEYYEGMDTVSQALTETKSEVKQTFSDMATALNETRRQVSHQVQTIYTNQKTVFEKLRELSTKHTELDDQIESTVSQKLAEKAPNLQTSELFERLDMLNRRIDELQGQKDIQPQQNVDRRSAFKEKIFKKVTRHSKEYVKGMLISLVKKYNRISGLNLREIVVEEQGIVSKSSFYRLLAEIEAEDSISVVQEGKEKHYIWGPTAVAQR